MLAVCSAKRAKANYFYFEINSGGAARQGSASASLGNKAKTLILSALHGGVGLGCRSGEPKVAMIRPFTTQTARDRTVEFNDLVQRLQGEQV